MILTPASSIAGYRIVRTLGLVRGSSVRGKHLGQDAVAFVKGLVGGEIEEYTQVLAEAREQALDRMAAEARSLGAHAVTDIQFVSCDIADGAAEMLAYGNAVWIEPERRE